MCISLPTNLQHIQIISWSRAAAPSFVHKTIDVYTKKDIEMERNILPSVTHMLYINQVITVSLAVSRTGATVSEQYYWDILLSQQMLAAVKHVADDNFVFQQDRACTAAWCAQL